MQRRNVLLPEPLEPMMLITSPALRLERHALEHFVVAVALVDVVDEELLACLGGWLNSSLTG